MLSAAAILVIGYATVSTGEPARASGGGAVLINGNTGLCVDDSSEGFRDHSCAWASVQAGYQSWVDEGPNVNTHWYQNGSTDLCIDDSAQYGLRGYPCSQASYNSGYQEWDLTQVYQRGG